MVYESTDVGTAQQFVGRRSELEVIGRLTPRSVRSGRRQIAAGNLVGETGSTRSLVTIDEFDAATHEALIDTLAAAGSPGLAATATERYVAAMADLGVDVPVPSGAQ